MNHKDIALSYGVRQIGSVGSNTKTVKSDKLTEYLTYIVYLAPYTLVGGGHNLCPKASPGCAAACLNTAGRGKTSIVQNARINRAKFYVEQPEAFLETLKEEIQKHVNKCEKTGKLPAVRVNGTSDIVLEKKMPSIFSDFQSVQFYDYTKIVSRMMPDWKLPKNYHLTFSRSETNQKEVEKIIAANKNANIAAVFDEVPQKYLGRKVINGEEHDFRPIDPKGVIVGLRAKNKARKDKTGFTVLTMNGKQNELF